MLQGIQAAIIALGAGLSSVLLAWFVIRRLDNTSKGIRASDGLETTLRPMVFLFRDNQMIDATPPARALLASITGPADDWRRLCTWLAARFPDVLSRLDGLDRTDRVEARAQASSGLAGLHLLAERLNSGLTRLTLSDPAADNAGIVVDGLALEAMEQELELLRESMDRTPMLSWRQDSEGRITWANAAYLDQAEVLSGGAIVWPLPRLLDVPAGGSQGRRAQLDIGGRVRWYDCHSHQQGEQTMMFALPADAAVRAERSLREFVQTLTKTFADLPIGLAIFDRDRKLQLFNPALIDLTGLPAGFLTARPTLFDFLDQLREARMVPEPKDYRSWRQQMNTLETAAATGRHVETWSLPGGQTYRVTGRPHPDGAVAFLFEDITSEISMTRKFRGELMLGKHVLDGIEDGVAVFGQNGKMLMANDAYDRIWGQRSGNAAEALIHWQQRIGQSGAGFEALRKRLTDHGDSVALHRGAMTGPDGGLLSWTVAPLGSGRVMVQFRPPEALRPVTETLVDAMADDTAQPQRAAI
ncbi:PAS-domain containing protein (plasmid) [Paracoccus sp. TK19116]|uniref:PAS-domain containing protein n=1 Tax=Paracoccus albicereus TaxID=2922394 RepID=A0ABT1MLL8_9RHOB|nr:PAS-domain containing protein [Paracoccus albicereus]MCQ0969190.1 PAS-domain containing protein [Paracoccus albicereus]